MPNQTLESCRVGRGAVLLSVSETREEEAALRASLLANDVHAAAFDFGGAFVDSVLKLVEKAVAVARREGIIGESRHEEGAVAGAAREALQQVADKAIGLNVGGKIAVARYHEDIAVAVFFSIGLGHLNEACIGMGHRVV